MEVQGNVQLLQEWNGARKSPYKVKCKDCGLEFNAAFHGSKCTTPCPKCTGKVTALNRDYGRNWNFKVMDNPYKITSVDKYLVKGDCGHEYRTNLAIPSECPICKSERLSKEIKVPEGWELVEYNIGKTKEGNCIHKFKHIASGVFLEKPLKGTWWSRVEKYYKNLQGSGKDLLGFEGEKAILRCKTCGCEYTAKVAPPEHQQTTVCPQCKVGNYTSQRELEIRIFLESKGIKVLQSCRTEIINPETGHYFEIDLYLPDYKVALEFNGYKYHSVNGTFPKNKNYHKLKTESALNKGIMMYHFWEDVPTDLVKSIILSKLGLSEKVYARKCKINERKPSDFFKLNHREGDCKSVKAYSLEYQGDVVACLSVRRHKEGVEIARFACKQGIQVIGGFTKLLKCVERDFDENIVSYCDRDLSPDPNKTVYKKSGFEFVGYSSNILKFYNHKTQTVGGKIYPRGVYHRQEVWKSRMPEKVYMFECYNSGNLKFIKYKLKSHR